jgi:hypothetical protein
VTRPFHHDAPDRLKIREGGGWISVFGLPFFSAGIFMLLAVTAIIPVSNSGDMPPWGWFALTGMGPGVHRGRCRVRIRSSLTTLDVTRRLVIKQWGLLIPLRERTYPLNAYSAVTLGFVRGDSDTAINSLSASQRKPDLTSRSAALPRMRTRGHTQSRPPDIFISISRIRQPITTLVSHRPLRNALSGKD